MNRDDARRVWREAYRKLAPTYTPELAGKDFDEWWDRTRPIDPQYLTNPCTMILALGPYAFAVGMALKLSPVPHAPQEAYCVPTTHDDPEKFGVLLDADAGEKGGRKLGKVRVERQPSYSVGSVPAPIETSMERGNRIHKEMETYYRNGIVSKAEAEEIERKDAENLFGSPALSNATPSMTWRCENLGCPQRAPVRASSAPKCYTCDRPMARFADTRRDDLLLDYANFTMPQSIADVGATIDQMKRKLASAMMIPPEVFKPTEIEDWIEARKAWRKPLKEKLEIRSRLGTAILAIDPGYSDTAAVITGIAGGQPGQQITIRNAATPKLTLRAVEVADSPANRFQFSELDIAKHAVGTHLGVASVDASLVLHGGATTVHVEARLHPDQPPEVGQELNQRLYDALPAGIGHHLVLHFSRT